MRNRCSSTQEFIRMKTSEKYTLIRKQPLLQKKKFSLDRVVQQTSQHAIDRYRKATDKSPLLENDPVPSPEPLFFQKRAQTSQKQKRNKTHQVTSLSQKAFPSQTPDIVAVRTRIKPAQKYQVQILQEDISDDEGNGISEIVNQCNKYLQVQSERQQDALDFLTKPKTDSTFLQRKIKELERQVRQVQQSYNSVISEKPQLCDVTSGESSLHDIKAMDNARLRLACEGRAGPIIIKLDKDVEVWVDRHKEPSDMNHIWKFSNKRKIIIYPQRFNEVTQQHEANQRIWNTKYLYISIGSETGCCVNVSISFLDQVTTRSKKEFRNQKQQLRDGIKEQIEQLSESAANRRKFMQHYNQIRPKREDKSIVNQNKKRDWEASKMYSQSLLSQHNTCQLNEAKQRREWQQESSRKYMIFSNIKWQVLKDMKVVMQKEATEARLIKQRVQVWLKLSQSKQVYKQIFEVYRQRLKCVKQKELVAKALRTITRAYLRFIKCSKSQYKPRNCLVVLSNVFQPELKAKTFVSTFLQKSAEVQVMSTCITQYCKSVCRVQRAIKRSLTSINMKRLMISLVFDREFDCIRVAAAQRARKNKKLQAVAVQYEAPIEQEVKKLLLLQFYNICNAYFKLNFYIFQTQLKMDTQELPLVFSVEDSKQVFKLQRAVKHLITNVFSGTKVQSDDQVSKKQKTCLLANITKALGKDKKEKQFQIAQRVSVPMFRVVPDKETIHRMVQKYFQLVVTTRNPDGSVKEFRQI